MEKKYWMSSSFYIINFRRSVQFGQIFSQKFSAREMIIQVPFVTTYPKRRQEAVNCSKNWHKISVVQNEDFSCQLLRSAELFFSKMQFIIFILPLSREVILSKMFWWISLLTWLYAVLFKGSKKFSFSIIPNISEVLCMFFKLESFAGSIFFRYHLHFSEIIVSSAVNLVMLLAITAMSLS